MSGIASREETMCMEVDRRYTGRSTRIVVAYKIFKRPASKSQSLLSQYGRFYFLRRQWSHSPKGPGFHAYKLRKNARACSHRSNETIRKVRLRGLLGSSRTHYIARYLWVN